MIRQTVVLDWDGTLAYSHQPTSLNDDKLPGRSPTAVLGIDRNGLPGTTHLFLRPHSGKLLAQLAQRYDLVLWSYGVTDYIAQCLQATGLGERFERIITRELMPVPIKDLAALQPDLTKIVIVDDSNDSFGLLNPVNCIDVPSWDPTIGDDRVLPAVVKLVELHFGRVLRHYSNEKLHELRQQVLVRLSGKQEHLRAGRQPYV
jgi:hypothetical protein